MFKSIDNANVNPAKDCSNSCIFGMGYGLHWIMEFSCLKSDTKRTVPFDLGTINKAEAYSESVCRASTFILQSLCTLFAVHHSVSAGPVSVAD